MSLEHPEPSEDELYGAARGLARIKRNEEKETSSAVGQLSWVIKALYGFGVVVALSAWYAATEVKSTHDRFDAIEKSELSAKTEWDKSFAQIRGEIAVNKAKIDATEKATGASENAEKLLFQSVQGDIQSIKDLLKSREELVRQHQEMWFMKEHGISNKDDFYLRNHYNAPSNPETDEQAKPKPGPAVTPKK